MDKTRLDRNMTDDQEDKAPGDWKLWPPSPKVQIILIAAAFGLFNLVLLAIWAFVMIDRF
jgi:hypothetical protein